MDTKGLQKEFINWCKSNKKQPKSKEETQQLFVAFMKEKHPEEYKAAMENQLKQAQKALHGAKLQYVRSLKNQCPEGEELYYYKKGGSVGCGCKKKENGGEVVKAQDGVVAKFKNDLEKKLQQQLQKPKWTDAKDNELRILSGKKNLTPQELKRLQQLRNEFKNSSNTSDYELEEGKKGIKIKKDCGGAVAKFKYLYGGAFFGGQYEMYRDPQTGEIIQPYVQKTPTAPDATERFRWGSRNISKNNGQIIREVIRKRGIGNPARIQQIINGQDTTYIENPGSFMPFVKTKNRIISNNSNDRKEFDIMGERFKKAWDVTNPDSRLKMFDFYNRNNINM